MAIYSNEAKNEDGTYDPMHLLARWGTRNLEWSYVNIQHRVVGGDEYYYEFIYRGSIEGTRTH